VASVGRNSTAHTTDAEVYLSRGANKMTLTVISVPSVAEVRVVHEIDVVRMLQEAAEHCTE
jgi:hypothetical protein